MKFKSDVCVVGNGAIGKAAALGFAQAGLSVSLLVPGGGAGRHTGNFNGAGIGPSATGNAGAIRRQPALDGAPPADMGVGPGSGDERGWDTRVYALNHAARAMLTSVKVWDALDAARIAPIEAMQVHGDAARHAGSLGFDAYGARVGALAWIVEDSNLNQALDAALRFAPNLKIVAGRASRLAQRSGEAQVHLENGDIIEADLVVGADGAQSWVRSQCEIGFDYRPYRQRAVVANFATSLPHHGVARQWFTAQEGIIALLPLPQQRVSLVWSAPDGLAATLEAGSLTALAERLSALPGNTLGALTPLAPQTLKSIPLSLMRAHEITAPRVALIGDAAHVIHPLAGHGMNLGFADLAGLLASVAARGPQRDCGDARVLGTYGRGRKEEILLMQLTTDVLERLFSTDVEPLRVLRNAGMNLVDRLPFLKRLLMAHAIGAPR